MSKRKSKSAKFIGSFWNLSQARVDAFKALGVDLLVWQVRSTLRHPFVSGRRASIEAL
jgi:hypothetical protein